MEVANSIERMRVGFWGKSSPKADDWGHLESLDKVKMWEFLSSFYKKSLGKCSLCVSLEILKLSFLSLFFFWVEYSLKDNQRPARAGLLACSSTVLGLFLVLTHWNCCTLFMYVVFFFFFKLLGTKWNAYCIVSLVLAVFLLILKSTHWG